jgi:hypothetical protein
LPFGNHQKVAAIVGPPVREQVAFCDQEGLEENVCCRAVDQGFLKVDAEVSRLL